MPLLKGRCISPVKPLNGVGSKDTVYVIPHTHEQFLSKEEYEKRLALYNDPVWTCQCTGAIKLTHQEALESEQKALRQLNDAFPVVFEKPVLELVHQSSSSLDSLVDLASKRLYEQLVIGERVRLRVTSQGSTLRGVIVKMDTSSSSSSDKLNGNPSSSGEDVSVEEQPENAQKKSKLLPFKYGVKLDGKDSIINGIPASDLIRDNRVPNKDLLKLFIRAHAVRSSSVSTSPWTVEENFVRKHSLQANPCSSPNKVADTGDVSRENGFLKLDCCDKDTHKSPRSQKKSCEQLSPKKLKGFSPTNLNKKFGSPSKQKKQCHVESDCDSDMPLSELQNCVSDDDDVILAKLKRAKKKLAQSGALDVNDDDDSVILGKFKKEKKKRVRKEKAEIENQAGNARTDKKPHDSSDEDDDIALAVLKKKKKVGEKAQKSPEKNKKSASLGSPKKKMKQVTLFQMKGLKKGSPSKTKSPAHTPKKTPSKSPLKATPKKSPYRLPPVAARLKKALKEPNKAVITQAIGRCCKELTSAQIQCLPDDLKTVVLPKFEAFQEKKKIDAMNPADREEYLKKKKEERKQRQRELMKKRMEDAKRRYEDTELELKPLPMAKIVSTPDGLANELFGDVVMVTEFLSCYKSLLMPDDNHLITADQLMRALADGNGGFQLVSKILVIMLQTLLQDQLAEDYKELTSSLSELPVNEYTASELVRLCLRPHDAEDSNKDYDDQAAEDEVAAEIVDLLESSEFCELDAGVKLQILVGLCHRIMASYSVQDYMDEKQQAAGELWKKRIAEQKVQKDKKRDQKKPVGKTPITGGQKQSTLEGMLEHSKPADSVEGSVVGDEVLPDDDDDDMVSKVKRRRILAAKAAEEKKRKEVEEKLLREKEFTEQRQLRSQEAFEKSFREGIAVAKQAMRRTPLGLDRNHDRYWLFPTAGPGIYIEKGWACEDIGYNVSGKGSVPSSASESESDAEGVEKTLDKTLPHTGQNLWFVIDTAEDIQALSDSLHPLGARESKLRDELKKNLDTVVKSLTSKANRSATEVEAKHEADSIVEGTREELQDLEVRLRHGGLGGVACYEAWEQRLQGALTVKDFADCLLETQAHVLEKFVTGMMAKSTKQDHHLNDKTNKSDADADDSTSDKDESIKKDESQIDGIKQWQEAVSQCSTLSRLNVLMGILESCVKWEKSAENVKCRICRKKGEEDRLLLCDECNQPYHLYCLRPALYEVPSGEWFCPVCSPEKTSRRNRSIGPNKWQQDDSDEDEGISEDIEHEHLCAMCGEEGELVECSTCPSSFHMDCHDPPLHHIPRQNTWKCVQCKTGVRLRKSRRSANKKRKRYLESEDDDDENNETPAKKPKKSASQNKRSSDVSSVQDSSRGQDARGSTGRYSKSSKENHYHDGNKETILNIIDKLSKHRQSWPYLEPVDADSVPDYYQIVRKPMDLQTMENRCVSDFYASPQKFIDDFVLMMNNAILYNTPDSPVCKTIEPFEKYFVSLIERFLPNCSYRRR